LIFIFWILAQKERQIKLLRLLALRQLGSYIIAAFTFKWLSPPSLRNFFDWRCWPSEKRRHFLLNLLWGVAIAVALHLISYTGLGQQILDETYDFLVKTDFRRAVIQGKDDTPVSDSIRLVLFDKDTYEKSPGQGFWTPREVLGKSVIRAVELGARVVLVDFRLDKAVPLYYADGAFVEENQLYLSLLRQAADLAEKNGAIIILPRPEKQPGAAKGYTRQYYELLDEKKAVIRQGNPGVFYSRTDRKVRHFHFYEMVKDQGRNRPILSMAILAAIYQWHGIEKANGIIAELERQADRFGELPDGISIPSDGTVSDIRLYHQETDRECLPARFKFRIAPRELIQEDYGGGFDPQIDIPPSVLLSEYFDTQSIQGKTVLIGSAYKPMGDIHVTPVGDMPGIFLIANGMNLFLEGNQIYEHHGIRLLTVGILIVLLALVFVHLSPASAGLVLTTIILLLMTPVSIWLFSEYGMFLDLWIPVLGIGIRGNIANAEKFIKNVSQTKKEDD